MAARSGPGTGVIVTITILGVAALGLFISTIVFLNQYRTLQQEYASLEADLRDFVSEDQRRNDEILRIRDAARAEGRTAVMHLKTSLEDTIARITGNRRDAPDQVAQRLERSGVPAGATLLGYLASRDADISRLRQERDSATDARDRAQIDLRNQVERSREQERVFGETVAALEAQVNTYRQEVDDLRSGTNTFRQDMDERVDGIRGDYDNRIADLQAQLADARRELTIVQNQLQRFRDQARSEILTPADEYALVDGQVIEVPGRGEVFINRGRQDRIRLGMTFAVYSRASDIQPDGEGQYPPGKASIEVIDVDETFSKARVIPGTARAGDPLVKGDVIANALYDPEKVYTFVVFGNFDTLRDGRHTPEERRDVESLIRRWGGQIVEDLTGDVDFLVLGARPSLPPPPGPDDPIEIIRRYQQILAQAERYDRLWDQAVRTRLPVLTQNRLYTLIGQRTGFQR